MRISSEVGKVSLSGLLLIVFMLVFSVNGEDKRKRIYGNDFSEAKEGALSEEFLILEGSFTIEKQQGESYLRLSENPPVEAAVQFGKSMEEGGSIQVRVKAERQGRRYPRFGIGLHGATGFKLWVIPSGGKMVLHQGTEEVQSSVFTWHSGEWYYVELSVVENGSNWTVSGRVWPESEKRPDSAQIEYITEVDFLKGRPYVLGMPSSGAPIFYDDIEVRLAGGIIVHVSLLIVKARANLFFYRDGLMRKRPLVMAKA